MHLGVLRERSGVQGCAEGAHLQEVSGAGQSAETVRARGVSGGWGRGGYTSSHFHSRSLLPELQVFLEVFLKISTLFRSIFNPQSTEVAFTLTYFLNAVCSGRASDPERANQCIPSPGHSDWFKVRHMTPGVSRDSILGLALGKPGQESY